MSSPELTKERALPDDCRCAQEAALLAALPAGLKGSGHQSPSLSIPRWNRRHGTPPRFLSMTNPQNPRDSGAAPHDRYIAALEIMPSAFKRLGLMTTDIAVAWVTWAGSLVLLALISLVSYAVIERPARAWTRALLAPRLVQFN
jgi:hypothetical protein